MQVYYYVAFILDTPIYQASQCVIDAGVDLLAGPFLSQEVAWRYYPAILRKHSRLAAFTFFAKYIHSESHARITVIPVTLKTVAAYNRKRWEDKQANIIYWPLQPVPVYDPT